MSFYLLTLRWLARLLAVALVIFWGGFFIEHVGFLARSGHAANVPPRVWIALGTHFLLLVGLVLGWIWERLGGVLVLVAAPLFFVLSAGTGVVFLAGVTILPGILWVACSLALRAGKPPGAGPRPPDGGATFEEGAPPEFLD